MNNFVPTYKTCPEHSKIKCSYKVDIYYEKLVLPCHIQKWVFQWGHLDIWGSLTQPWSLLLVSSELDPKQHQDCSPALDFSMNASKHFKRKQKFSISLSIIIHSFTWLFAFNKYSYTFPQTNRLCKVHSFILYPAYWSIKQFSSKFSIKALKMASYFFKCCNSIFNVL